jgi:hypothetical protein
MMIVATWTPELFFFTLKSDLLTPLRKMESPALRTSRFGRLLYGLLR